VSFHERRYSSWLLGREESLTRRRDNAGRLLIALGVMVAVAEALFPWERATPDIPPLAHIGAAALMLPVLYFMLQADYRAKLQGFTRAMDDLGWRLAFLDPLLETEQAALLEQYHGAMLKPTQRWLDTTLHASQPRSLNAQVQRYFRAMPSPVHEADRMGWLSIFHPKTALSWLVVIALCWMLTPYLGIRIGSSVGLTLLPYLLVLFLAGGHLNSRFAYELALYNWLRLG